MSLEDLRARLGGRNFLSPREAGRLIFDGLDERTVRRAVEAGQIPSVKVGNRVLIPVAPLLALLEAPASSTPAAPLPAINPAALRVAVQSMRASLDAIERLLTEPEGTDGDGTVQQLRAVGT